MTQFTPDDLEYYSDLWWRAVQKGDAKKLDELMKRGVDPDLTHVRGGNALLYLPYQERHLPHQNGFEAFHLLRPVVNLETTSENGDDVLMRIIVAMEWRSDRERAVMTQVLLSLIPSFDTTRMNRSGKTALIYAAGQGAEAVLEALIPGSDCNHMNQNGDNALMLAAARGQMGSVQRLLPHTSHLQQRNINHQTAGEQALRNGFADIADLISVWSEKVILDKTTGPESRTSSSLKTRL